MGKGPNEDLDNEDEPNENNPLPALYDDQIAEFFKNEPKFAGVIAADQILDLPKKLPMGFVMNKDASDEPGSHWIGVYISGDSVEYFDPLAEPPSKRTIKDIHELLLKMHVPVMMKFKVNKIVSQLKLLE